MLRTIVLFLVLTSLFSTPSTAQMRTVGGGSTAHDSAEEKDSNPMMNHWSSGTPKAQEKPAADLKSTEPVEGTDAPPKNNTLVKMGDAPVKSDIPLPVGDFAELKQMGSATVDQVIDPLRIRLKDKRIIQLVGLDIPDLNAYETGPLSVAAVNFLKPLLENKKIRLYQTKNAKEGRTNQMSYELAHVVLSDDNTWVQGALLSEGFARIRPSERNPEMAAQMITLEIEAAKAKRGLWATREILTPETADKAMNDWAVVEGIVKQGGLHKNIVYLNFGADWRSDFTVSLPSPVRKTLEKNDIKPLELTGKKVRVHGWVESYNGPHIKLNEAAWLEVIE